jgi:hypothetical protein
LDNLDQWEPRFNRATLVPEYLFIESVGNGVQPIAGTDYPQSLKECYDARWAAMDHRYEDWSNPATYLAHLYLRTDSRHFDEVLKMRRANGTVNPVRLENYFRKAPDLVIDSWAWYPDTFPERTDYRYKINWEEVAREFNSAFKEMDQISA